MEKFKKIIIFLGIIIVVLLIIFCILNTNILNVNKNGDNIDEDDSLNEVTEKPLEKNSNGFSVQKDANIFYSVLGGLNRYITVIQMKEEDYADNEYNIKDEEEKNKAIKPEITIIIRAINTVKM